MQYYMHIGGQQVGPFDESQLIANGLTSDTPVWAAGMPDWRKANEVPELGYLFYQQQQQQQAQPQQYGYGQQLPPQQPQYGYGQQPQYGYSQPQYGYDESKPPMPETYLVWAILTTLLCCLPFGIVAIVKSTQVTSYYNAGDYQHAEEASRSAKKWSIWSAAVGVTISVLYCIFLAIAATSGALEAY